ncbi:MAG: HTH-type transcriptional regulator, transcriptional repressor of biosynthesis s [Sphingomonadales bacterium]|jgi:NadR type nicotinamide-nucleotide adenylyltransferase|nr:HTH-type transcriptional regulator, transcriptional repressor of biosynthesis s [Sphingomonadales bacterium]
MTRGFVLGKFMPPHAGHVHLCETARRLVDVLTILVCWLPDDPIPGPLRLQWMKQLFPDCRVIGHDAVVPQQPDDDPEFWPIWRKIVKVAHPEPIDLLFAGEDYGMRLAHEVGARFIQIGPRLHPDLSGSAVRADPWAHWEMIPPPVRPHFARTICLHGPESTGKSTLSAPLAAHFDTIWVPEYGRVHCQLYGFELDAEGLATIGRTQSAMTRAALPWCNKRLIVDTDALTTAAWSLMILGHIPAGVMDGFPLADLYLLTDIDIPWEDDGTRYYPRAADRRRFMAACERVLDEAGARRVRISGGLDERFAEAVAAVEVLRP